MNYYGVDCQQKCPISPYAIRCDPVHGIICNQRYRGPYCRVLIDSCQGIDWFNLSPMNNNKILLYLNVVLLKTKDIKLPNNAYCLTGSNRAHCNIGFKSNTTTSNRCYGIKINANHLKYIR